MFEVFFSSLSHISLFFSVGIKLLNKKISSHGTSYFGDHNKHHHIQFEMLIIL